ncbi:hypothetical protein [Natrialba swarupiae]|uniref:Uncharacterized protein n=1 Tax=Natrialba swarupiae TaxID=2448032 RepID=A0A5D5ANI9_9EURY|nr:hypothetical protein [Natrialba swarupiae]TYT60990.1 hypothetical protein FYC77_15995 [Natrialba swarupiae]
MQSLQSSGKTDDRLDFGNKCKQERMIELQSRELEKGAHLREETVDEHVVDVPDGRLERITKDDGKQTLSLKPDVID